MKLFKIKNFKFNETLDFQNLIYIIFNYINFIFLKKINFFYNGIIWGGLNFSISISIYILYKKIQIDLKKWNF